MTTTSQNTQGSATTAPREDFRPISNSRGDSICGRLKFYGRMLLDLQILTIFRDAKKFIPDLSGEVLDVGCGQSPYRFLLNHDVARYHGIDIADAEKFDYSNPEITPFNGQNIPFKDNSFDAVICTEVLEHVFDHRNLVSEIHRVLKPGGTGMMTVPWSARYHYIPHDYFRYTPSALKLIFSEFSSVIVSPRGSDLSVIANKLVVLWARNLKPKHLRHVPALPIWILGLPFLIGYVCIAHIALLLGVGSVDDPLGYTIFVRK